MLYNSYNISVCLFVSFFRMWSLQQSSPFKHNKSDKNMKHLIVYNNSQKLLSTCIVLFLNAKNAHGKYAHFFQTASLGKTPCQMGIR